MICVSAHCLAAIPGHNWSFPPPPSPSSSSLTYCCACAKSSPWKRNVRDSPEEQYPYEQCAASSRAALAMPLSGKRDGLEDVRHTPDQDRHNRDGEHAFEHHKSFGPARQWIGVGGAESRRAGEGHEQVIEEKGHPVLEFIFIRCLLRKHEIGGAMPVHMKRFRSTTIDLPVQQAEEEDICGPEQRGRAQEITRSCDSRQCSDELDKANRQSHCSDAQHNQAQHTDEIIRQKIVRHPG